MSYWKDTMLVGVPQIDSQHKLLVKEIDKLMEASMQGKGREEIGQTLNFVVKYTVEHFRDEEILQAKYKYPGVFGHKQIHANFCKDVTVLVEEFEKNGPSLALSVKLNKVLAEWVINHIITEDKKVGEHIRKVGL